MTLKLTIKKQDWGVGCLLDLCCSEQGQVADFWKGGNEHLVSYNAGTFLTDRGNVTFPRKNLLRSTSEYNVQIYLTKQGVSVLTVLINAWLEDLERR